MRRVQPWLAGLIPVLALPSLTSCAAGTICTGQCAPPYELEVDFIAGTSHATAEKVLTSCASNNPIVIRVGTLHDLGDGRSTAFIYTHVFGDKARTSGLLTCLRSSGVATATWPD